MIRYAQGPATGWPIEFNDMVRGLDVHGNLVMGVVRGFGPPRNHYLCPEGYPDGAKGPAYDIVILCKDDEGSQYVEAYVRDIVWHMSLGPSPWEVGCKRDDQSGAIEFVG